VAENDGAETSGVVEAAIPVAHVLVVDDDPDIRALLETWLTKAGHKVRTAAAGEDALARVRQQVPDLVFLDFSMPGMDGLDVLKELRGQALDTAIVMTTAFGSEQVAVEALRHEVDDYLVKPFTKSETLAVLERTVSRLRLKREHLALQRQREEKLRNLDLELPGGIEVGARLRTAREDEMLSVLARWPRLSAAIVELVLGLESAAPTDREFVLSQLEALARRFGDEGLG
jgi:DNA-binding response OmpR family regulator